MNKAMVNVGGRVVEYARAGAGTPVVLSSPTWWPLDAWMLCGIPELRAAHDVIAFNHRGIGASDAGAEAYTIGSMAGDMLAFADALQLPDFHVVGYANGCGVGVEAARRSDRIRSLTMAAPSNGLPASAPSPVDEERKAIAAKGFEPLIRSYPMTLSHPSFQRGPMAAALGEAMVTHLGTVENFLKHAEARRGYSLLEMATGLALPALVIVGADDVAVRGTLSQIDAARELANVMPGAKLSVPEDVGHMVFWEAPGLWSEVLAFLAGAETASRRGGS